MSGFLFAYGTLQPEYAPSAIAHAVGKLRPIGEGFANGLLYNLGGYPGAVLDPSSGQKIAGLVLQLPEDSDILREFDAYEDYDSDVPNSSPFIRVLHPVVLADGSTLQCWIYVWNGDPASAPVIPGGRFNPSESGSLSE